MLDVNELKKIMDYMILQNAELIHDIKLIPKLEESEATEHQNADLIRRLKGCQLILRQPNNILDTTFDMHVKVSSDFRKRIENVLMSTICSKNSTSEYDYEMPQFRMYYNMLAINAFDILCMVRDIFIKSYRDDYLNVDIITSNVADIKSSMMSVNIDIRDFGETVQSIVDENRIGKPVIDTYMTFVDIYRYFLRLYNVIKDIDNEYKLGISDLLDTFREYMKMSTTMGPSWNKSVLEKFELNKTSHIRLDELPRLSVENTILYGKERY